MKKKITSTKKKSFLIISLITLAAIGGSLPLIYFQIIDPRLGLMSANIGISALEISAVDNMSITFVIKLKIMGPFDKNIIVPKLDLNAYAGALPLGVAWSPTEFIIPPFSFLMDYNALLYLRVFRGEGAPLNNLFSALLHESDLPIELVGNAMIGGLPFPIPPMAFSLSPNPYDPLTIILDSLNPGEKTDMVDDFLTYIQENGVNLEELTSAISLDALGLVNFLTDYGINIFGLFYYLDTGQEWTDGFGISNYSRIENLTDRVGVQQAIYSAINGNPDEDIKTNLMKIAWDLDDIDVFNGTPWSRVDNSTYEQTFSYADLVGTSEFPFNQSYYPEIFVKSFFDELGFNNLLRDRIVEYDLLLFGATGLTFIVEPTRQNGNYYNSTTEEWNIIPGVNFSLPTEDVEKEINYIRLRLYHNTTVGPLDILGDGNISTFNGDNLSIYDLKTYNPGDPEASLLARYDNDNIDDLVNLTGTPWGPGFTVGTKFYTPWFPTNSVKVVLKTNDTLSDWGFQVDRIGLDFDTPFENCPVGNYTPEPLDFDSFDVEPKSYFTASAFLKFDLWCQTFALNQTEGDKWEDYWYNFTNPNALDPWPNPLLTHWTSNGMSDWDLLWWLNNHWDMRFLLNNSGQNALVFAISNLASLMNPLLQSDFFYGDLPWFYGLGADQYVLLKDIPGFQTTSAAHAYVDFMPGAPYANMSEPLSIVKTWERNSTHGEFNVSKKQNFTQLYGVADIPGTGGPYEADVTYMKALKYNNTGFLENMLYLALTQDSRDPSSVWAMMNQWQLDNFGQIFTNTYDWNTQPLPLDIFINAVLVAAENASSEAGLGSLLYGYDLFELLDYIQNNTGTSLGSIFDAAGIKVNDLIEFIAESINPTFLPIPFEPNALKTEELLILLIPAFIAIPSISIYIYITKRRRSEISFKNKGEK